MAWTDEFNDVAWANGDYLSEIKLDQMVANGRWCRDQLSMVYLGLSANSNADTSHSSSTMYYRAELHLGTSGIPIWTSGNYQYTPPSPGTFVSMDQANIDLSGVTNGDLIDLFWRHQYSSDGVSGWTDDGDGDSMKLIKTQAMAYLSLWGFVYISFFTTYIFSIRPTTFIAHLETQTW